MLNNTVDELLEDLKLGKMVIIVDDENRENEGDLVLPADFVTSSAINFMSHQARGLICVALTAEQLDRLQLSLMVDPEKNRTPNKTAYTISVEAAEGITTGISSADRARTVQALSNPASTPEDIITPGHVFPIRSHKGGVLKRAGHTEASVDLCRLAGLTPAAVICEIVNPDGTMARAPDLKTFSEKHGIKTGTIEDLIRYRIANESFVKERAEAPFSGTMGEGWTIRVFEDTIHQKEHLVFSKGNINDGKPVLTRVHVSCIVRDFFGTEPHQNDGVLNQAISKINQEGRGVLVYLRPENKALAKQVQSYADQNPDQNPGQNPDQNPDQKQDQKSPLAQVMDEKDYGVGAQILRALGVMQLNLLSNAPKKRVGLKGYGLQIVKTTALA